MSGTDGLDRTRDRLVTFRDELSECLEEMTAARQELDGIRDRLHGLWDDSFRAEFDRRHDELDEPMKELVTRAGKQHVDFLDQQIKAVRRYLHG